MLCSFKEKFATLSLDQNDNIMKFGRVENPENLDFKLPADHVETSKILSQNDSGKPMNVYVGCAKWNKQDLKNFYPRGTKDELTYYASQFNAIEMNSTFYRIYGPEQIINWREKTPEGFRFFPKVNQTISHIRRLNDVQPLVEEYCDAISNFGNKLGMSFLQMNDNFGYKDYNRLVRFVENFPKAIPLAVELRNTKWFNDESIAYEVYKLFEKHGATNVLVDTVGRRDLLHMRLTTPTAFIRYVGANDHQSDRDRLDEWIGRLRTWVDLGLRDIYFFVHQNIEMESPLLSAYFIQQINREFGMTMKIPNLLLPPEQLNTSLF